MGRHRRSSRGSPPPLGYALFDDASPSVLAFTFAFAGGAILAMLSTSMMPEAYERAGRVVGLVVTFGFAVAYGLHWLGGPGRMTAWPQHHGQAG